jgi:ABC-type bacteriocin/lantibiotic exporter with double-glycine peptidase domain
MILKPSFACRKGAALTVNILLICFTSCVEQQPENVISLNQVEIDYACGPRCLWAFMQVTGAGKPDCDVNCIYKLIGKNPYSVTSLKDLKDSAQKLGFSATGYELGINDLKEMPGYAILPVGNASGTPQDPLHFILVKQVTKEYVTIINSQTLKPQTIKVSELKDSWKGYALVISADKYTKALSKNP